MTALNLPQNHEELLNEIAYLRARIAELEARQEARTTREHNAALQETIPRIEREELLQAVLHNALSIAGTTHGLLYLLSPQENYLITEAATGVFADYLGQIISEDYPGLGSQVWRTRKPLVIYDDDQWPKRLSHFEKGVIYANVGLPLLVGDKVIGVLSLAYQEKDRRINDETPDLLCSFCRVAAAALENERVYRELKRNRFFLETLIEAAPMIFCVFDWVNDKFVFVGETAKEIIGYSAEEVRGHTFQYFLSLIHPDDLEQVIVHFTTEPYTASTLEYRFKHPDGEWRWLRTRQTVLKKDPSGNLLQTISITEDITPEKHAEEQRRQDEAHARMLSVISSEFVFCIEISPEGALPWDEATQKHKTVWRAGKTFPELTGYTREELNAMPFHGVYHPDDRDRLQADQKAILKNHPVIGDYRFFRKDGEMRWIRTSRYPVWDAQEGRVVRYYGVVRDVTDEKHAEECKVALALEKARVHLLAEFMTNASHDFRTPLSTIYTSMYLLERSAPTSEHFQRHVQIVNAQVAHLNKLVDDLLNMSRLDGTTHLHFAQTDINRFLHQTSHGFQERARRRNQRIQFYFNQALPPVMLNPVEMQHAITEILENAMVYSPEHASIIVYTEYIDSQVGIAVCDNGFGIPEPDVPHVFERFYRVDKARQSGSTGLGLAIAERVVELHGGRIEIESRFGHGTSVYIYLPAISTPHLPGEASPNQMRLSTGS